MPDPASTVLELRQYTLHPFKRDVLVDLFEREFVESQEAAGMRVLGTFRDLDAPDRFVWLRGFAGMPARVQALRRFYGGPVWQAHRSTANATMIDSDDVLLLRPAWTGSGFGTGRPLPPRDAVAVAPGRVEARIHYLDAPATPAQLQAFDAARPALEAAGARLLAVLVSEPAPNDFPQLPVRDGEWVLAWFAQFRDGESHERGRALLAASPQWREFEDGLSRNAPRRPDALRLAPTARSRLPDFGGAA
ncbi:NIPSNAP family protein [Pseudoxanthomonas sangjuensis]|uniref:NIPSNAP family protein n=1 Tax=Pseudoxanthomonas sangjuensis TaxID=1503750 RepID=UPI001390BDD9|nr:NIPSNAP family protein [Pseudoxanthomonas sangjuensis]KAF1707277.1 NIPSNAP family protein [Pseudoxanthomonas sangjuensis]